MSKYITKNVAESIGYKLTQKIADKIKIKRSEISEIVSKIYLENLPKDIVSISEKHRKYFKVSHKIRCEGNGLNSIEITLTKSVISDGNWQLCILPSVSEAKKILKIYNELQDLNEKEKELKKSIENTLLQLRTYKRIEAEFPEAFEFLPKDSVVNTLAVPIEDIRSQLKALKP